MDSAGIYGLMVVSMKANGDLTICMEMEFTLGKMADVTKANMNKIRNMGMECMCGLMAVGMRAIGLMANNMGKASTFYRMVLSKLVYGNMARGYNGLMNTMKERIKILNNDCVQININFL